MRLTAKTKKEIVSRLQQAEPHKIYLFGSYATGTANKDSDIDLLLLKDSILSRSKEMVAARMLLGGLDKAFDVLVATSEEFEFYRHEAGSVYREISERGTLIYAK
jgi:predicted nucleotidyltransferase